MIAILSAVSSQAQWLLCDIQARTLLGSEAWNDDESSDLASEISARFEKLLERTHTHKSQIEMLMGLSGPGAFTGLRSSGAFLMGLAAALNLKLKPISTFEIYEGALGKGIFIPLQHQRAKKVSLAEAVQAGLGFLRVSGPEEALVELPADGDLVLGLLSNANWPSAEDIMSGARKALQTKQPFKIFYGLEPKISGVRSPNPSQT